LTLSYGQQQPIGLQVLSASLDLQTQKVSVQLQDLSDKAVVAYVLRVREFDADGKEVHDYGIGYDWVAPEPNLDATRYILPGRIASIAPFRALDALSIGVSVLGAVYADRTFEGITGTIFVGRRQHSQTAKQALELLKSYPATHGEMRERMKALLSLNNGHVVGVVANSLRLRFIPDSDHAPEEVSEQQWADIQTKLERDAAWYEAESQPQGAKQ
jgi:hypothetical protein